ncbi:MAG: O-antigen ligase family protein [Flavobacteriaceae bacterium]|nr:O-antigen ligase family protein [Flavobacteriaceae bacterium]
MMVYLVLIIPFFTVRIVKAKTNRVKEVLIAVAYVAAIEVFLRMTKAYLLYETGKYLVMYFIVIGLFYDGFKKKAFPYALYFLLLIPGILVTFENLSIDLNFRKAILFNISGPLTLSVVAIYTYGKSISFKDFLSVLNYIAYPLIAMTVYVFLYNPDLRDIITNTAANSAASGGYGPNQVATALGLGVFVLFSRLLIPYKLKTVHLLMMFFLAAMTYRGILTFSRGGLLAAVIMIVVFLGLFFFLTNLKTKATAVLKLLGVGGVLIFIWALSLAQTGGLIENRYTNKDALGREKGDITTGRVELATVEFEAFKTHPFFGVGVGRSKGYFVEELGIELPTHNEVSRMFSEHGLFGILALLILLIAPIANNPLGIKNIYFYPFLLFWFLTINHSAMRIAAPAVIYGLGLINITREKKTVIHRK